MNISKHWDIKQVSVILFLKTHRFVFLRICLAMVREQDFIDAEGIFTTLLI